MAGRERARKSGAVLAVILLLASSLVLVAGCGNKSEGEADVARQDGGKQEGAAMLTWPTPYQNPGRTGRGAAAGPRSESLKWTYEAGAETWAWSVLAADGNVLAGFGGKVVCLDAGKGTVVWEFSTGGTSVTTCGVGADGTVYVSAGSMVHALSGAGQQKWSYDVGARADEPCAGLDAVYVGSVGGRLVALDTDGRLKWEARVSGDVRSPSLDRQGNLYCGGSSFTLHAFDADGKKLWEAKPAGDAGLGAGLYEWANTLDVPSIGQDGTIYAGSMTGPVQGEGGIPVAPSGGLARGKLYAISPQGQLEWSYSYGGDAGSASEYLSIHSPSIARDGTLYCGTSIWRVLAIDPQGRLVWEYNTGEGQDVCPSVYSPSIGSDGLLYVATTSSKMICVNAQGQEQWRFDSGTPWLPSYRSNNMTPPPMGADGTLFSVTAEGKVYAWPGTGGQPSEGKKKG